MNELQQAISAVEDFNEMVETILGNERNYSSGHMMLLETNGTCTVITFMGVALWSSEDDEREFIEEENEYEPLSEFLVREARKVLEQFSRVLTPKTQEKVMEKGDFVHFVPTVGAPENGRIKAMGTEHAFVVYQCDGKWDQYTEYTGHKTYVGDLRAGWVDQNGKSIPTPDLE